MFFVTVWALSAFLLGALAAPLNTYATSASSLVKRAAPDIANTFSADEVEQIKQGFHDALQLANAVTAGSKHESKFDPIFSKYFSVNHKKHVLGVFQKILDNDPKSGNALLGDITIKEDYTDKYEPELACTHGTMAETRQKANPSKPTIVLCKSALKHGAIDHPHKGVADINCKTLGSRVSWHMETLGSILLHEYTHWKHLMSPLFAATEFGATVDDPELGYGPKNVVKLAKRYPDRARNNADSYSWLANEIFWTMHCNKIFGAASATMKDDNDPYLKR